jgi:ABC-type Mn2+/Zn2+ transport system ATPase subunit
MKYLIVNWDSQSKEWEILHYSHDYTDVHVQWERFKKLHPNCKIFTEAEEVLKDDASKAFWKKLLGKK